MSGVNYKRIVSWCAEECSRQFSGEISVARMYDAWDYAINVSEKARAQPAIVDILMLGRLVDPVNGLGWRKVPVSIKDKPGTVLTVADFDRSLKLLIDSDLTPDEKFQAFEEIHPFKDGNGRVGALLFNWWRGTLATPVPSPMFRSDQTGEGG